VARSRCRQLAAARLGLSTSPFATPKQSAEGLLDGVSTFDGSLIPDHCLRQVLGGHPCRWCNTQPDAPGRRCIHLRLLFGNTPPLERGLVEHPCLRRSTAPARIARRRPHPGRARKHHPSFSSVSPYLIGLALRTAFRGGEAISCMIFSRGLRSTNSFSSHLFL
jgi:hypothetical protein